MGVALALVPDNVFDGEGGERRDARLKIISRLIGVTLLRYRGLF